MPKTSCIEYINRTPSMDKIIGLTIPLTMYVARHPSAGIVKGIHVSVISEDMELDSEDISQIYLASL